MIAIAGAGSSGCSVILDWDVKPDAGLDATACALMEPNDTFAQAMTITPGLFGPAAICVGGDLDYYRFSLLDGQTVTITATFDIASSQDLDLFIYDATQTEVSRGVTFGNPSEVITCPGDNPTCPTLLAGDYVALVRGGGPAVRNLYDLQLQVTGP